MALNGVDISGHQTDATVTEWLPLVDFVIVKATEGKGTTSAAWAPRVALARGAGKLVGHYHYAWPENGGAVDAAHFLAVVGSIPGEVAVLDFEPFGQTSPAASWPQYVIDFADTILKATSREPWLYSEDYHLGVLEQQATPAQLARIRRMPLWKAGNGNAYVTSPDAAQGDLHGWPALACWQWTSTPLDRDVFYGTAADWRGDPTPTPTPEEPPVPVTTTWRGVTVDPETARYLTVVAAEVTRMAKAAGVPDWTVTPIPRCGSYQTSTAASAGTHAGGGAIDINAVGLSDKQARVLESAARKWGGTAWFRPAISGLWQRHVHVLRSDCTDLASAARTQVRAYRAGYNGLANNGPDTGNRSWVNVTWGAVKSIADTVTQIGGSVVAAAGFNYGAVSMDMSKQIDSAALRPKLSNAHIARLESAIWNWRGLAFRKSLVKNYKLTKRAQLYNPAWTSMLSAMVGDSYKLLHQLEPRNGWLTDRQARGVDPLPTWPGPKFLHRIGFKSVR